MTNRTESQREERRLRKAQETGAAIVRRLPFVARGFKAAKRPLGLTEVQERVVACLVRTGNCNVVAAELGMNPSTVRQRLTAACRKAGAENTMLLVLAWAQHQWEREYVNPIWRGLTQ